MDPQYNELLEAVKRTTELASGLPELANDIPARQSLVEAAKALTRTIQTPVDRAWEIFYQPHHLSALRVAWDAGWLSAIAKAGESGITAQELAERGASDPALVARIMRLLAAGASVKEVGYKTYASNELVDLFQIPGYDGALRHTSWEYSTTLARMPEYFAERGYQEPRGGSVYSYVHGAPLFENLSAQPERLDAFHGILSVVTARPWLDVYPIERLSTGSAANVAFIDVGGANGHELMKLADRRAEKNLSGKLILQDRAEVVEKVPAEWRKVFDCQAHDFLTPQTDACRHARAYYMRFILHDWPDADCITILSHLRDAMKPGYSTLLINELVLPDTGCLWSSAAFDITMMACLAGKERTKSEWHELIEQVKGLRVEKLWKIDENGQTLVEVSRS